MSHQNLNGRLCQIVDELVHRGMTLEQARNEFEKLFILSALRHHNGNMGRSAESLGVHRNTLRNKVTSLGIGLEDIGLRRPSRRRLNRTS